MVYSCAYGICPSSSRKNEDGVFFIPFAKPTKDTTKCLRWIAACNRKGFNLENINRGTYICNKHFVGSQGPTKEFPDPVIASSYLELGQTRMSHKNLKSYFVDPVLLSKKGITDETPPDIPGIEELVVKQRNDTYIVTSSDRDQHLATQDVVENKDSSFTIQCDIKPCIVQSSSFLGSSRESDQCPAENSYPNSTTKIPHSIISQTEPHSMKPSNPPVTLTDRPKFSVTTVDMPCNSQTDFNIDSLSKEVRLLDNWLSIPDRTALVYAKFVARVNTMTIIIADGTAQVKVYGEDISEESEVGLSIKEKYFNAATKIECILKELDRWNVCCGVEDKRFVNLFKSKAPNTYRNAKLLNAELLHHKQCTLLVKHKICENCYVLRETMRKCYSVSIRPKPALPKAKTNYRFMTMEQKRARIRAIKKDASNLQRELRRQRAKFQKHFFRSSLMKSW